ncbi:hypothetical protein FIM08_00415 [SAR202 cluster bacterium AC-647-N09_OGT_505m]|nr:hypothetical protein [SAR202 cluster bacterium AC-647-N09_OGT_505m]
MEYLYHNLAKVSRSKPVIALSAGIGTSGRYLLGRVPKRIVALPRSMIDSIGVISMCPVIWGAVGAHWHLYSRSARVIT